MSPQVTKRGICRHRRLGEFSGAGLELIALGCGICYMLSGHHGLYSSQTFVTNKLRSEYMSHKWRVKVKKEEE